MFKWLLLISFFATLIHADTECPNVANIGDRRNVYFYHGYSEYCGTYNSDHYPVVIDLNL
jgi:hypothetical protein